MPPFPIDPLLPALFDALRRRRAAVLRAPAGAGKTLRVPLALLEQPWLPGHRVVVVQPRGSPIFADADRMAALLGQEAGGSVGASIPTDSRTGPRTRVELVGDDLFLRRIQQAPDLPDVGALLFDGLRADSLAGPLALSFAREAGEALGGGPLLLAMTAGPEAAGSGGDGGAALLGDHPSDPVPVLALPELALADSAPAGLVPAGCGASPDAPPEGRAADGRVDPTALLLELAVWGVTDRAELALLLSRWPFSRLGLSTAAVTTARRLLAGLGAVTDRGTATPLGIRMAALGPPPRLARLILAGAEMGQGALACTLAALLDSGAAAPSPDAGLCRAVERLLAEEHDPSQGMDAQDADTQARLWTILAQARDWRARIGVHHPPERSAGSPGSGMGDLILRLLAAGYPDRGGAAQGAALEL